MIDIQAYDDMIGALGRFYRAIGDVNDELLSQTAEMQTALNDDYAEELCGKVGDFVGRMNVFLEDVIEVQRALDRRMTELFG